jgi:hypothetical protein
LARELIILPRFKRDYRTARKHPEFEADTLEYVFDVLIAVGKLPEAFREHRLGKRSAIGLASLNVISRQIFYSSTECSATASRFIELGHTSSCLTPRRLLAHCDPQGPAVSEGIPR